MRAATCIQTTCSTLTTRQVLLRMHEKVANRLGLSSQRNHVDPLKKLPYELVDMIFQYLPFDMLM
jgi:hypothetical protein